MKQIPMDFHLPSLVPFVVASLAFSLFLYSIFLKSRKAVRKLPPQAGGAWPIIGHLPLLVRSSEPLHVVIAQLADTYGPIFTFMFGVKRTLVLSSSEMAKECLKTYDKVFASRVSSLASEILGYNYAFFPFSSYGYYFSHVQKMVMAEVLSPHRVEMLKHLRESEVSASMKEIYDRWTKNNKSSGSDKVVVPMKDWFAEINQNVVFRMIIGKRISEATNYTHGDLIGREVFKDWLRLNATFVLSDALPFLRWLDLGGHEKTMRKVAKEVDQVLQGWLEEHKQKKKRTVSNGVKGDEEERDFMDLMLSVLDDAKVTNSFEADIINKATSLSLLLAGVDVTTGTLTWALSLLLNSPKTLKKVQEEIDQNIGRERAVKESDVDNLVYLQAVIKETLRLYPPGPTLLPHASNEDCVLAGYHIPANTRVLVNVWKIHRDPKVWPDPNEFRPERFFTTHSYIDIKGQDFELIPFGSGRRMCAGIALALRIMPLTLASLLHGFEIATPTGEPVDMRESMEFTNHRTSQLDVLLTPRLPAQVYEEYGK
ncbi:hypothetical protein ACFX13_032645 [Malus domestica]|uniref:cytochrome P450 CYP82D47-like n=1 Tax=Malus sylvestris TaxID=3752 RepID=UPI0010AB196F|nr:cytochrome P450 CYP82D47-like [Malus domestica]XP_050143621.1 cytochrome P450 CYP82D47-like [Malus sylvestris]